MSNPCRSGTGSFRSGRGSFRSGRGEVRELAHGAIGAARITAFGVSNVAPAGAVVGGLVIVVAYAGFASPLVVLIALAASLCCAVSIAEFAAGLSVVLVYLAVNISAIRAFRTSFRDEFRLRRHLLVPATAVVFFLFPLWGILHPRTWKLMDLLPFAALGWLCLGVIAAGVLRARRPASFEALGRVFLPADDNHRVPRDVSLSSPPAGSGP